MNEVSLLEQKLIKGFAVDINVSAGPFQLIGYPHGVEPVEKCVALLGFSDGDVVVRAAAYDTYLRNRTVADNEKTWTLGDVMEFFVQPAGRDDYFEFHLTPEKKRLQLHLQDYRTHGLQPFEEKVCDAGLRVWVHVDDGCVWLSEMRVSFEALGLKPGQGVRFAVCRYNYGEVGGAEMSSSFHARRGFGFHNPPAWTEIGQWPVVVGHGSDKRVSCKTPRNPRNRRLPPPWRVAPFLGFRGFCRPEG